ncbi:MAG: type II toxin-antitoxin system RelE/ParE family toxin [Zoogloeaceae bacterium]|nr:type II toxin-antitoxin system RelE/ParE family toxin [Rhodocyclaceae bacterium]MCP5236370.1 type II toxin-antitoxin system RelE/ParE family toxin [Zoogloeaceae bacterium]
MRYSVLILRRAQKELKKLPAPTRERIAEAIGRLAHNPDNPVLDVKALNNDPEARYRLRVGSYRVKYSRDDEIRILEIVRVGHRKDVYR